MSSISDTNVFPCIWMKEGAKEAMNFYVNIFDNSAISYLNDIVCYGKLEGSSIMYLNSNPDYNPNTSISIMILSNEKEKITRYYNKLKEDGEELMPLGKYEWSEWYVWIKDKYGLHWQLYTGDGSMEITHPFAPTIMYGEKQQGKCKEAIDLFSKVFPDFKSDGVMEYPEGPMKGQVMHSQFWLNKNIMMAMDSGVEQVQSFNETISLVIECKDQKSIDHYWESLIENGGESSKCGWLKDKFGMSWQVAPYNVDELLFESGNPKAFENMLKMEKIIIADLMP